MLAPNKRTNQPTRSFTRTSEHATRKIKLHEHAWQYCQGRKGCEARIRAVARVNPSLAHEGYSHRRFPLSTPFSYLFFYPLLVSQARIMPICQNISFSTYHASITEQPQQPCKATRATLASNPGNYGRQHYRQPCQLRQPSPPLSTL